MDCRTNCPEVCKRTETIEELDAKAEEMRALAAQHESTERQNAKTAKLLAKLPNDRETAEARSNLQEAVISVSEARELAANSIGLLGEAVNATMIAVEAIVGVCPGGPVEIPDPAQSGRMILACASPAVQSE